MRKLLFGDSVELPGKLSGQEHPKTELILKNLEAIILLFWGLGEYIEHLRDHSEGEL